MLMRRSVALLTAAAALLAPAVARGSQITMVRSSAFQIFYAAGAGERNALVITQHDCGDILQPDCKGYFDFTDPHVQLKTFSDHCLGLPAHTIRCYYSDPDDVGAPYHSNAPAIIIVNVTLGDGNDSAQLQMNASFARIDGGSGNDVLTGEGSTAMTLIGGSGNDVLTPVDSTQTAIGGSGDDVIYAPPTQCQQAPMGDLPYQGPSTGFGALPRLIDGGPGTDLISFAKQFSYCGSDDYGNPYERGVVFSLSKAAKHVERVENIRGTIALDTLTGDKRANWISGDDGIDHIYGGGGDDILIGGGGGTGYEVGYDSSGDILHGGPGDDSLQGSGDNDYLDGGSGNDRLLGGNGDNLLIGGAGDDRVIGGENRDVVIAGVGRDIYRGAKNICLCIGIYLPVVDSISYRSYKKPVTVTEDGIANDGENGEHDTVTGFEEIIGGSSNDVLHGTPAADVLFGNGGNDKLYGEEGSDALYGGRGNDLLSGGDGTDELVGSFGADRLSGGDGADVLLGGSGADTFSGGSGFDVVYYSDHKAAVTVTVDGLANDGNGTDNAPVLEVAAAVDGGGTSKQQPPTRVPSDNVHTDMERLVGTARADVLTGGPLGIHLRGDAGNDKLIGGPGNDTLDGGDDDDVLVGRAGTDAFLCGPGSDRVTDLHAGENRSACELSGKP
jgi:Ca2+-binding RTX toxin-like protein